MPATGKDTYVRQPNQAHFSSSGALADHGNFEHVVLNLVADGQPKIGEGLGSLFSIVLLIITETISEDLEHAAGMHSDHTVKVLTVEAAQKMVQSGETDRAQVEVNRSDSDPQSLEHRADGTVRDPFLLDLRFQIDKRRDFGVHSQVGVLQSENEVLCFGLHCVQSMRAALSNDVAGYSQVAVGKDLTDIVEAEEVKKKGEGGGGFDEEFKDAESGAQRHREAESRAERSHFAVSFQDSRW